MTYKRAKELINSMGFNRQKAKSYIGMLKSMSEEEIGIFIGKVCK